MPVTNKLPPLVRIDWIDSLIRSGWSYKSDLRLHPHRCITVGFLIEENDDCVIICSCINFDPTDDSGEVNQYNNPITIPKVAITARRCIRLRN